MATTVGTAEQYVRELLEEGLTEDYQYHNLTHTVNVVEQCRLLAERLELSEEQKEILELAAWFHDTGYTQGYEEHEINGTKIAAVFLEEHGYSPETIEEVNRCILATVRDHQPQNLLEEIIRDADLSNLGRADYLALLNGLRHEWATFRDENYKDKKWYNLNHKFVKKHRYYTSVGQEMYDPQRKKNQQILSKLAGNKKKKPAPAKPAAKKDTKTGSTIGTNRSAQMMFKTALRNHMDLSNLADNKANIMLSVNALIVTIAVPMGAGYLNDSPHLMAPLIVLLLTCLTSMIFATLATRPIPMTGITTAEDIQEGRSNLFFFGNFYKMGIREYDEGMDKIVEKDANLESAIKRDLYFLGSSLGRKYNQLRICYNLFMIGVVLSVIMFGLSYAIF